MTRYPPAPFDWDSEMDGIEQRLDDHLTDDEVRERLALLDHMAQRPATACQHGVPFDAACQDCLRSQNNVPHENATAPERTWQSILGLIGFWGAALGLVVVAFAALGADLRDDLQTTAVTAMTINVANTGALMTFHADGRIIVSEKAKPDETAAAVIEAMRPYWRNMINCR